MAFVNFPLPCSSYPGGRKFVLLHGEGGRACPCIPILHYAQWPFVHFLLACLRRQFGLMMDQLWASFFALCIYQADEIREVTTALMRLKISQYYFCSMIMSSVWCVT